LIPVGESAADQLNKKRFVNTGRRVTDGLNRFVRRNRRPELVEAWFVRIDIWFVGLLSGSGQEYPRVQTGRFRVCKLIPFGESAADQLNKRTVADLER
jgi:hypothetical protein